MSNHDKLQRLTQLIDFEFNPDVCDVRDPHYFDVRPGTVISEVGNTRYARFVNEAYKRPSYTREPVDAIVEIDEDFKQPHVVEWEQACLADPDYGYDQSLHGLLEDRTGYIALYYSFRQFDSLYQFQTINGPMGANNAHQVLGRNPGVDIPLFVEFKNDGRENTAGQITEALADMKILVPGVHNFYLSGHDMKGGFDSHGESWPHTHPAVFRHLSQVAQDTVEQYGERIHYTEDDDRGDRPEVVVSLAKALDNLIFTLTPSISSLALMEHRIRDGRYDSLDEQEIMSGLLRHAMLDATYKKETRATNLLVLPTKAPQNERYRRGHWIGMQLMAGVVDTRLALHEERPHHEATSQQTARTLSILNALKSELNRRFSYNKEHLIAA